MPSAAARPRQPAPRRTAPSCVGAGSRDRPREAGWSCAAQPKWRGAGPWLQHLREAPQPLARRLLVVHERHADIAMRGVHPLGLAASIGPGQHLDVRLAPQLARRLLAVTDVEPQEKAAARRVVAEAVVQHLFGNLEVLP